MDSISAAIVTICALALILKATGARCRLGVFWRTWLAFQLIGIGLHSSAPTGTFIASFLICLCSIGLFAATSFNFGTRYRHSMQQALAIALGGVVYQHFAVGLVFRRALDGHDYWSAVVIGNAVAMFYAVLACSLCLESPPHSG